MEAELYAYIKRHVRRMLGIDLDHYKEEQMRRRLDSWLVRTGAPDWGHYFRRLPADSQELSRFRDYLTINVSSFFRDVERWQELRKILAGVLLPVALERGTGRAGVKVWSAGCSIGAEPYSLAILLEELACPFRHSLLATDIDRSALEKARRRGPYTAEEIQNLSPEQRQAYLEPEGPPYFVRQRLATKVEFYEHDLLVDPFPVQLDLIVCRNVVIYFTSEAKETLYRRFYEALRPGGFLFVGATEIIPQSRSFGFEGYSISFYQKTTGRLPDYAKWLPA